MATALVTYEYDFPICNPQGSPIVQSAPATIVRVDGVSATSLPAGAVIQEYRYLNGQSNSLTTTNSGIYIDAITASTACTGSPIGSISADSTGTGTTPPYNSNILCPSVQLTSGVWATGSAWTSSYMYLPSSAVWTPSNFPERLYLNASSGASYGVMHLEVRARITVQVTYTTLTATTFIPSPLSSIYSTSAKTVTLAGTTNNTNGTITWPSTIAVKNISGTTLTGWSINSSHVVTIPAKTAAGTYYITGTVAISQSAGYAAMTSTSKEWALIISKATPTVTLTAGTKDTYDGTAVYAQAKSSIAEGTIYYGASSGATTYSMTGTTTAANLASMGRTNVGTTTIYAFFRPNSTNAANYNDSAVESTTAKVTNKATPVTSWNPTTTFSKAYSASAQTVATIAAATAGTGGATPTYSVAVAEPNGKLTFNTSTRVLTLTAGTAPGTYYITLRAASASSNTTNYNAAANVDKKITVTVTKASWSLGRTSNATQTYTYNGHWQGVTSGTITPNLACTVYYSTSSISATNTNASRTLPSGSSYAWNISGYIKNPGSVTIYNRGRQTANSNYNEWSDQISTTITVNKATPTVTFTPAPSSNTISFTYNGSAQYVKATASVAGTLYRTSNGTALSSSNYTSGTALALEAGVAKNAHGATAVSTYNMNFYFVPTDTANYNSIIPTAHTFKITKATGSVSAGSTTTYYQKIKGAAASNITITSGSGTGTWYLGLGTSTTTAPTTWAAANTNLTSAYAAGTYYVWGKCDAGTNHNAVSQKYLKTVTVVNDSITTYGAIGTITFTQKADFPAGGVTLSTSNAGTYLTPAASQTNTWASGGTTSGTITYTWTGGTSTAIPSLGTTVTTAKTARTINALTVTATGQGSKTKTGTTGTSYNQAINSKTLDHIYIVPYQPDSSWITTVSGSGESVVWGTVPASGGYLKARGYYYYKFTSGSHTDEKQTDDAALTFASTTSPSIAAHTNGGYRVAARGTTYSTSTLSTTCTWTSGGKTSAAKTVTQAKNVITDITSGINAGASSNITLASKGETKAIPNTTAASTTSTITVKYSSGSTASVTASSYGSWGSISYSYSMTAATGFSISGANITAAQQTAGAAARSTKFKRTASATFTINSTYNNGLTSKALTGVTSEYTVTQSASTVTSLAIKSGGSAGALTTPSQFTANENSQTVGSTTNATAAASTTLTATYDSGNSKDVTAASLTYSWTISGTGFSATSANTATLSVKAASRGTTYSASTRTGTAKRTATYAYGGKTVAVTTAAVTLTQAANTITLTWSGPNAGAITTSLSFAASKESKTASNVTAASCSVSGTFSSGSAAVQGTHYTLSGPTYSWTTTGTGFSCTSSNAASLSITAASREASAGAARTGTAVRTASYTAAFTSGNGGTGNGTKTASTSGTSAGSGCALTQAANAVTAYGDVYLTGVKWNNTIAVTGGTATPTVTYAIPRTYTSGGTDVMTTGATVTYTAVDPVLTKPDVSLIQGSNGISRYDNNSTGSITITRVNSGIPAGMNNNSGYALKIVHADPASSGKSTSPGLGGWYFSYTGAAGNTYRCSFDAYVPEGYTINFATNSIGTGGTSGWTTSDHVGHNRWQTYTYYVTYGTGAVSSTFFFYLTKTSGTATYPITWYITNAGIAKTNSVTSSYVNTTNGSIAVPTRGTRVESYGAAPLCGINVKVTYNSKSVEAITFPEQAANAATYGAVTWGTITQKADFPANGVTLSTSNASTYFTPSASQTISFTSGATRAGSITYSWVSGSSTTIAKAPLPPDTGSARTAVTINALTCRATGEGSKTADKATGTSYYRTYNRVTAVTPKVSNTSTGGGKHFYYANVGPGATSASPTVNGACTLTFASGDTVTNSANGSYYGGTVAYSRTYSIANKTTNGFTNINTSSGVLTCTEMPAEVTAARASATVTSVLTVKFTNGADYGGAEVSGTLSGTNTCTQNAQNLTGYAVSFTTPIKVEGTTTCSGTATYTSGVTKTVAPTSVSSATTSVATVSGTTLTGKAVGTSVITGSFTEGGQTQSGTKTLTVNKGDGTISYSPAAKSVTFSTSNQTVNIANATANKTGTTISYTLVGVTNASSADVTSNFSLTTAGVLTVNANTGAGTYTVKVTASGTNTNYTMASASNKTFTLTINKATNPLAWSPVAVSCTYATSTRRDITQTALASGNQGTATGTTSGKVAYIGGIKYTLTGVTAPSGSGFTTYFDGWTLAQSTSTALVISPSRSTTSAAGTPNAGVYSVTMTAYAPGNANYEEATITKSFNLTVNMLASTLTLSATTVEYHNTATITAKCQYGTGTLYWGTSSSSMTNTLAITTTAKQVTTQTEVGTKTIYAYYVPTPNSNAPSGYPSNWSTTATSSKPSSAAAKVTAAVDATMSVTTSNSVYNHGNTTTAISTCDSMHGVAKYQLGYSTTTTYEDVTWSSEYTAVNNTQSAINAGTYHIWYRFLPDSSHSIGNHTAVTVSGATWGYKMIDATSFVDKAVVIITPPTKSADTVFDGASKTVFTLGSCTTGGTMYYYNKTNATAPAWSTTDTNWKTSPTVKYTNVSNYYLYYYCKVTDTNNYTSDTASGAKVINTVYSLGPRKITAKPISNSTITATLSPTEFIYNGDAHTPTTTVIDTARNNLTLTEGTSYTVEGATNTDMGTYTVTIKGKGNYGGSRTLSYEIKPGMWVLDNGVWTIVKEAWKVVNGAWVKQTVFNGLFTEGVAYKRGS